MFAGVPVAESVMTRVARHLAGLGLLPEKPAPPVLPAGVISVEVAVVGGGAAGLAAVNVLAKMRVPLVLCEKEDFLGGRLATAPVEAGAPAISSTDVLPPDSLRLRSAAVALFDDARGRFLAVVCRDPAGARLLKVYAKRFLIAVGGHPRLVPFENNDLPGVFAGRAASYLVRRCAMLPGKDIALLGYGAELYPLASLLESAGASIAVLVDLDGPPPPSAPKNSAHGKVLAAHGRNAVRGLTFDTPSGRQKVSCDAVIVSATPAATYELVAEAGAKLRFAGERVGFAVEADAVGRTSIPGIFVAGEVAGAMSAKQAVEFGQRVGEVIAGEVV